MRLRVAFMLTVIFALLLIHQWSLARDYFLLGRYSRYLRAVQEEHKIGDGGEASRPYLGNWTTTSYSASDAALPCNSLLMNINVSSKITGTLCFSSTQCSGNIELFVVNCTAGMRRLSGNATLSDILSSVYGPDDFLLRLEGPEVHLFRSKYLGSCKYVVELRNIETRGLYNLGLEWLYDQYFALDELTNHFPPIRKAPLLRLPAKAFETNYHLQQCTLPSAEFVECSPRSSATASDLKPLCSGYEKRFTGKWMLVDNQEYVFTRVRVKKLRKHPILFQWALQRELVREWVPHSCRLLRSLSDDLSQILKGKKIVIGGDSQLRALYYGVANFLSGFGLECIRNISSVDAEPTHCIANVKGSQRKLIREIQVDFVDDHFLEKLQGYSRYAAYDIVVVGFAQHPASKEHWSFDKYRRAVRSRAAVLRQLYHAGKTVVWYLAPQYPHTQSGYPVVVRDWRTDARLKLFNTFAASELGFLPMVDAFSISEGMSHTSPDQAHFTNFVSYEIVLSLITVINSQFSGRSFGHA